MNRRTPWTVFGSALAGYLAVGLTLSLHFGYLLGDALSRTSAAQAVLLSRDPHVSAIGFIFTPLTALAQLPVVAFASWWPAITRWNISGIAVSAVFMAGAVVMMHGICRDRGLPGRYRLLITVVFAINPMIVFYGANGMSEAGFLFFLCWAVRRLIRWVNTDDVHDLLLAGVALALAFLARYEGVVPIAFAAILVAVVTVLRKGRPYWKDMRRRAILDAVLVAGPGTAAFLVWITTSWLITGEALAQLSSSYGNAAILTQSGGSSGDLLSNGLFSLGAVVALGPTLLVALPFAVVLALRRRDLEFVVAPLLFGGVLGFQAASYITGSTFGFLRFFICAVPLAAVVVVQLFPAAGDQPTRRAGAFRRHRPVLVPLRSAATAAVVLLCALTLPVTGWAMLQPTLSSQQYALGRLFDEDPSADDPQAMAARRIIDSFSTERRLALYLDNQDLPEGSILVDTVYGFAVLAASEHPKQFVVPSDLDFTETLNDPESAGVRYLLTVPNEGRGVSDAVNRRYPTIYDNGADLYPLVLEVPNDGADQPDWRLYRVPS
ncbi:ABC transporter [Rhodococcus sp. 06-412-2C]|uniref:glycosyltransferase family 39 protein n=1 Tax=unclassified Rhodococcus (in: high G+C Gram-positive bacteria) TaxID=192944 RepID=UPI000B9AA68F|nr:MULTISPECIES: glycosyltransferase family 39 protein [unclassified Rhodococcus (in: high G+C Gram-positive bacteria)]OZC88814.1 ABC transporter [Rhodococcus sp. 06-412-2C]OZD03179.1 ABC transporter [Rhodococcus sp. 06-412-2B]